MIPLAQPSISALERSYVAEALRTTQLSAGPFVERFESAWAARCDVRHSVAVTNGTTALQLALQSLGCGAGDEVLVPAFTFAAVAAAVALVGARPVYVDVDPTTWCIDPCAVTAAVTPRTVGVIAVHSYGIPAPLTAIEQETRKHGLWLVEDGAEAHGALLDGRPVGSIADIGVFSFHGNKILAAGEGGALTTDDAGVAAVVKRLANQGTCRGAQDRYAPTIIAGNHRMTDLAAAVLCAQVERMDVLLRARRRVEASYRRGLGATEVCWPSAPAGGVAVPWLASFAAPSGRRDAVMEALNSAGVQARRVFPAIPDLAPYRASAEAPVARDLAATALSLPTFPDLADTDVERISAVVRGALDRSAIGGASRSA